MYSENLFLSHENVTIKYIFITFFQRVSYFTVIKVIFKGVLYISNDYMSNPNKCMRCGQEGIYYNFRYMKKMFPFSTCPHMNYIH